MTVFLARLACFAALASGALAQNPEPRASMDAARTSPLGTQVGYSPITREERIHWVMSSTLGPARLAGNALVATWGTMENSPEEFGPHWDGFAKRYGLRTSTVATGTALEAAIGSLWAEDPRYFRTSGQPFARRLAHVAKMTVFSVDRHGNTMPAYARFIAVPTNSYISNAWRPDSQTSAGDAAIRIQWGFLSRFIGNAFTEFAPHRN
jgi:hypothetical protein